MSCSCILPIDDILVAIKLCACNYCFLIFKVGPELCWYYQKGCISKSLRAPDLISFYTSCKPLFFCSITLKFDDVVITSVITDVW